MGRNSPAPLRGPISAPVSLLVGPHLTHHILYSTLLCRYKGNGSHGLRPHFKPGYGCMREVAAYLMDVDSFSGVPPTLLVHCEHPGTTRYHTILYYTMPLAA